MTQKPEQSERLARLSCSQGLPEQRAPLWCDMRPAVGAGIVGAMLLGLCGDNHPWMGLIPISIMVFMIGLRLIRLQYWGK